MIEINLIGNSLLNNFTIIDENNIQINTIDSSTFSTYTTGGFLLVAHRAADPAESATFDCTFNSMNEVRNNALGIKKNYS